MLILLLLLLLLLLLRRRRRRRRRLQMLLGIDREQMRTDDRLHTTGTGIGTGTFATGTGAIATNDHVGSRGLRCQRVCCYGTRSALESGRQQIISASRAHKRSSSGSTAAKDERHRALQVGFDSVRDLRIVCFHRTTGSISLPRT